MMAIPHLFRCPISLDLFTDPVILSTGQTYDRGSIEKWFAAGNQTCPVTMQRLNDPIMVSNHNLRHLIDEWILSGTEPHDAGSMLLNGEEESSLSSSLPSPLSSFSTLKRNLGSKNGSFSSKMEALKKIRILSVESDTGRHCLIELGFFPLVLELVFRSPHQKLRLVEVALDCVMSLSPVTHLDSFNILKEQSNISAMFDLFQHGNDNIKTTLCQVIEVASTSGEVCIQIGRRTKVFQILNSLTSSPASVSEASVKAIAGLCSSERNRPIAIQEGVMDGLINYLSSSPSWRETSRALETVEALAGEVEGRNAVMRNSMGVNVLVKMVFRVSEKDYGGSEHAVGALEVICGSKNAMSKAINAGLLTQLLLLLQSQCGVKAKAKGRTLLKLLSSTWEQDF